MGAAIGIGLHARVEVELSESPTSGTTIVRPESSDTALVQAALTAARSQYEIVAHGVSVLAVSSEIPVGRGLKSSSAVASAVVGAVADALGMSPGPLEVARLSARASRASGTSATGAFDDALAGVRPGILVTDNRSDTLLRDFPPPAELEVVVWAPEGRHPPSPQLKERFAAEHSPGKQAAELALQGDWAAAMAANSTLVERVMGYRYGDVRAECHRRGAVGAGTSGLGPAFAAFVRQREGARVEEFLRTLGGTVVTAPLTPGDLGRPGTPR